MEDHIFFYTNLNPRSADAVYQDSENPKHGKFWSGGKGNKKVSSELYIQILSFLSSLFPLHFPASLVSFISSSLAPIKVMIPTFFFFFFDFSHFLPIVLALDLKLLSLS